MIGRDFVTAGRAIFTLSGRDSRFTYKVSRKDPEPGSRYTQPTYFVGLLTGPNNEADYRYLGILDPVTGYVRLTRNSKFALGAPSVKAIQWALPLLWAHAAMPPSFGIHHEGKCGRCGRTLTVPESIAHGFGPECLEVIDDGWIQRSQTHGSGEGENGGGEAREVYRQGKFELARRSVRQGQMQEMQESNVAHDRQDLPEVLQCLADRPRESGMGSVHVHEAGARERPGRETIRARQMSAVSKGASAGQASRGRQPAEQRAGERPSAMPEMSHDRGRPHNTDGGSRPRGRSQATNCELAPDHVGAAVNDPTAELFADAFEEGPMTPDACKCHVYHDLGNDRNRCVDCGKMATDEEVVRTSMQQPRSIIVNATGLRYNDTDDMVTDASDLGLLPGRWPDTIQVVMTDGRGVHMDRLDPILVAGELAGYAYGTRDGRYGLTVFND